MNADIFPRLLRKSCIALLWSCTLLACTDQGSFRLQIVFPDQESRAEVSEVHVWALEPGGRACPALMAGEVQPGEMVVLTELVVEFPQGGESSTLRRVPAGAVMFFASGTTGAGALILRGCTQVELTGGKDWLVVLNLFRVCTPDPAGEIPNNQIDDDCDGSTDECEEAADCEDQNGCTADFCVSGQCQYSNFPNDLICSDGNPCTQDDKCFEGACTGTDKDCSDYTTACLDGVCDPQTAECTQVPKADGSPCDDGLYCTDPDACQQGVCTGSPLDCGDGDDCTTDVCREDQDVCDNLLLPRPGAEGPPGDGSCSNGEDDDCDRLVDDQDPNCFSCSTDGDCNDGNPCTADACVDNVCQNTIASNGTRCSDDLFCTVDENCIDGACVSTPRDCSEAADACNQGVCLEDQDRCAAQPKPDNTGCEDGLYCTVSDRCQSGSCVGGPARDCNDGVFCTVDDCNESQGRCDHEVVPIPDAEGPPGDPSCSNLVDDDCDGNTDLADGNCYDCLGAADCDDNNPCTQNLCTAGQCQNPQVADGTACPDDLYCTTNESCSGGVCSTSPRDCSAFEDVCNKGVCLEASDECAAQPRSDATPCNDGMYCTLADHCLAGTCTGGQARSCEDGDFCTQDTCDEEQDHCVSDPGAAPAAESPAGDPSCSNGVDDDCDGATDADDNGCQPVDTCPMGDGTLADRSDYAVGSWAWSVATGDFNADGILDLAVSNRNDDSVSVLLGDGGDGRGDGTFSAKVDYTVGTMPLQVITADFNTDGILDLAVANYDSDNLSILIGSGSGGRGTGAFAAMVDYNAGDGPVSLAAGDFNADGILDLAVANDNSNNISILLGNGSNGRGDGTFAARVNYSAGLESRGVTVGDFNADGILDLAVANYSDDSLGVLLGNGSNGRGNGSFAGMTAYTTGSGPRFVTAGDFDADGILDLATANEYAGTVSVLLGNGSGGRGSGTFASRVEYGVGAAPHSVTAADFDADGILDLAVSNQDSNYVNILRGNGANGRGNGTFAAKANYYVLYGGYWVAAADFNSDGILDLAVPVGWNNIVSILPGQGSGGRGDATLAGWTNYPTAVFPTSLVVGDFDSDGIQDLAVTAQDSDQVSVLLGNGSGGRGNGTFAASVNYPAGSRPSSAALGDFDCDGILDLAVANRYSDDVRILKGGGSDGKGNGTFTAGGSYPVGDGPRRIAAGDFNSDGILDLATTNQSSNNLSVLLGNGSGGRGDGTFATRVNYTTGAEPWGIAAADFNSDQILDLVVANGGTTSVSVLLGNGTNGRGDGTFAARVNYTVGDRPRHVAVGDFNFDNILDLAVANGFADTVSVLLGNGSNGRGNGTFAAKEDYSGLPGCFSVAVCDFNADGIRDLGIASYSSDEVNVLLGNGSDGVGAGTFAAPVDYVSGHFPVYIVAGDFNSDGIVDLAAANSEGNSVGIYIGNGTCLPSP